jgi:hypothetical protein
MMRLSLPQELAATFCDASNADVIGVRAKNLGPGNVQPTYRLAIGPWSFLDVQPRSARPVISFPHQKPSGRALSLRPSHAKTPRSSGGFSLVTNDDGGGASGDDDDASVRWQPSVRQSRESGQL